MYLLKYITLIALTTPLICLAQGHATYVYDVPFYRAEVLPGSKIYVNYNFLSHLQKLVCKVNSTASSYMEWSYKNAQYGISLPSRGSLTLKNDVRIPGYWADPNGTLIIFNANAFKPNLVVSCQYRNFNY